MKQSHDSEPGRTQFFVQGRGFSMRFGRMLLIDADNRARYLVELKADPDPALADSEKAFEELLRLTKKEIVISVPNFKWLKISSNFSNKCKKRYMYCIKHENFTDEKFLKNLGKKYNLKPEIKYLSNKFSFIRNLFGRSLASEVVAIYCIK